MVDQFTEQLSGELVSLIYKQGQGQGQGQDLPVSQHSHSIPTATIVSTATSKSGSHIEHHFWKQPPGEPEHVQAK
jgi:hypothetical protein